MCGVCVFVVCVWCGVCVCGVWCVMCVCVVCVCVWCVCMCVCVCVCVCGAGYFINCRDALNCIASYYITASACVRSVLNTLSETLCDNVIIPGKLSHVHLGTCFGFNWNLQFIWDTNPSLSKPRSWNLNFVM